MMAFDDDRDAWVELIPAGYKCKAGMIYHPDKPTFHVEPDNVYDAINYLCEEWGYGFVNYGKDTEEFLKQ